MTVILSAGEPGVDVGVGVGVGVFSVKKNEVGVVWSQVQGGIPTVRTDVAVGSLDAAPQPPPSTTNNTEQQPPTKFR